MNDETVYVAGANQLSNNVFHTDRGCKFGPGDPREMDRSDADAYGYRVCKYCAGTVKQQDGRRLSLRERIEAGEVDV